jgi:hypothetical protein
MNDPDKQKIIDAVNRADKVIDAIRVVKQAYDSYYYLYHFSQSDLENLRKLKRDLNIIEKSLLEHFKELV